MNGLYIVILSVALAAPGPVDVIPGDPATVDVKYKILRELARDGDAEHKFQAFMFAYMHRDVLSDRFDEARSFLLDSAEGGHRESQYMIGYMLLRGESVEQDAESGLCWLRRVASQGHQQASFWIGVHFLERFLKDPSGRNAADNFLESEEWLERAAKLSDNEDDISSAAKVRLGRLYLANSIEDSKGWEVLINLSDVGYAPATATLDRMYAYLVQKKVEGQPNASSILKMVDELLERNFR